MSTIQWRRSILAGLFEYSGVPDLLEEPVIIPSGNEELDFSPNEAAQFSFHKGAGRRMVIVKRLDDRVSAAEIWFCEQQQRSTFRLAIPIVPFPAYAESISVSLPAGSKGKLFVMNPGTKLSMGGTTVLGDARTMISETQVFRITKQRLVKGTGQAYAQSESEVRVEGDLRLSPEDCGKIDRIHKIGERLTALQRLPNVASEDKARFSIGWARAVTLSAVFACPANLAGRLDEFQEAPNLESLLRIYWPTFIKFKEETEGLQDVEIIWCLQHLITFNTSIQ